MGPLGVAALGLALAAVAPQSGELHVDAERGFEIRAPEGWVSRVRLTQLDPVHRTEPGCALQGRLVAEFLHASGILPD